VHQVLYAEEFLAQAAGGMKGGEIVVAEIPALEQRDGECITYGHRYRRAGGWG
jgi:hypothetical protein